MSLWLGWATARGLDRTSVLKQDRVILKQTLGHSFHKTPSFLERVDCSTCYQSKPDDGARKRDNSVFSLSSPLVSPLVSPILQQAMKAKAAGSSPAPRWQLLLKLDWVYSILRFNSFAFSVMRSRAGGVALYSGD